MKLTVSLLADLTHWLQPYLSQIALVIIATLLVIYGDVMNKQVKRMISPYHFIVRTLAFVLICAFGYGLLILYATPLVAKMLMWLPYVYRGVAIILIFLLMGYLAENKKYI